MLAPLGRGLLLGRLLSFSFGPETLVRFLAPNERDELQNPTPRELERVLRDSPPSYWLQGGNGEAILDDGPREPSLWIKQPEPARFLLTFAAPQSDWLVPYDGSPCDSLVEDERGGDPFWIPRACLVGVDTAVRAVADFFTSRGPSAAIVWRYWHELPLPESYP